MHILMLLHGAPSYRASASCTCSVSKWERDFHFCRRRILAKYEARNAGARKTGAMDAWERTQLADQNGPNRPKWQSERRGEMDALARSSLGSESFLGTRLCNGISISRGKEIRLDAPRPRCAPRAVNAVLTSGDEAEELSHSAASIPTSRCACCGRRSAVGALAGALSASFNLKPSVIASSGSHDPKLLVEAIRGTRPGWYEELFAVVMQTGMKSYEMQVEDKKLQLFSRLGDRALDVLELGVGTGPNLKYYAKVPNLRVIGVDPNQHMEKYARAAASAVGLQDSQFNFVHAVGEALPLEGASVDAVVCTLVLCSVKDVPATLKEVKRVLRPGGSFLFIEHVAAPAGSSVRFWQDLLNPVQQFVADGCHLNRHTLDDIQDASFALVEAQNIIIPNLSLIGPHVIGMAQV